MEKQKWRNRNGEIERNGETELERNREIETEKQSWSETEIDLERNRSRETEQYEFSRIPGFYSASALQGPPGKADPTGRAVGWTRSHLGGPEPC